MRKPKYTHRLSAEAKKSIEQERNPRNPCKRFQSAACHQAHKRLIETKFEFRLIISNSSMSLISRKQQKRKISRKIKRKSVCGQIICGRPQATPAQYESRLLLITRSHVITQYQDAFSNNNDLSYDTQRINR